MPPAAAASAPRPLNLQLPSGRVEPGASVLRQPLRLMPPPPDNPGKLARDIERAGKEDCRKAHADKGLLGAGALALDALKKDSGCKW